MIRTDREHEFYSAATDASAQHLAMLLDILTTYAFTDPTLGYTQGMSDLLSPILMVVQDEVGGSSCQWYYF